MLYEDWFYYPESGPLPLARMIEVLLYMYIAIEDIHCTVSHSCFGESRMQVSYPNTLSHDVHQ